MGKLIFIFFFLSSLVFAYETEIISGNRLIVCDHGAEMLEWDLEFLAHATQSIEISGSFCGGSSFRDCLRVIDCRMEIYPDLQTHILSCVPLLESEDFKMVHLLEKKYPKRFHFQLSITEVILFPYTTTIDNHVKMVVVDGTYFSAGATNLDETMTTDGLGPGPTNNKGEVIGATLPSAQRDTDVVGKGPIAIEMRKEFFKLFALWKHYGCKRKLIQDPDYFSDQTNYFEVDLSQVLDIEVFENSSRVIDNVPIQMLLSGPHQKNNVITQKYEQLIKEAKEDIVIANLYSFPMGNIPEYLMEKGREEIPITLITNGYYDDSPFFCSHFGWANRSIFLPLFCGKHYHLWQKSKCKKDKVCPVSIYEFHLPNILYHQKMMVIDHRLSIIGSYNLGMKSHHGDYEMIFVIDHPRVAQDLLNVIEIDKNYSELISFEQACDWYFDLTIDWLARNQKKIHIFY